MDGNRRAARRPDDLSSPGIPRCRSPGPGRLETLSWKGTEYRLLWPVRADSLVDDSALYIGAVDRVIRRGRISGAAPRAAWRRGGSRLLRQISLGAVVADDRRDRTRGFSRSLSP